MNERIRELYQQAHMVREYPKDDPMRGGNPPTVYWGGERSAEKLALLIVQECMNKIENEASQYAEPVWAVELINDIKEHFGVEE
jgi:hypothetical protein